MVYDNYKIKMSHSGRKQNMYSSLFMEETEETGSIIRKAKKKLREIAILEKKEIKTLDEIEKINQKSDWQSMIEARGLSTTPSEEQVNERKQKQRDKTKIKNIEKQLREAKKRFKLEKEMMKQEFTKFNSKLVEDNSKLVKENNELLRKISQLQRGRQHTSSYYQADEVTIEEKIEEEFLELYRELGSYNQVYKNMMLKYHPDKCKSQTNGAICKVLVILKKKYVDKN